MIADKGVAEPALVDTAAALYRARNGIPDELQRRDRRRAVTEIQSAVNGTVPRHVRTSPLGPEWTDVFAVEGAPPDAETLQQRGWVHMAPLMRRLGLPEQRWAVAVDGRPLAAVQFGPPFPDEVAWVLQRCQATGRVTLKDVMELQVLAENGAELPPYSEVLVAAADIETSLGGRILVKWASGRRLDAPARLRADRRVRRVVVGFSGVDGAGKSSVLEGVRKDLEGCGVATSRVWLRPGMSLGRMVQVASRVKRAGRMDERSGVAVVAADPTARPASRRGLMGWAWSLVVTMSFLRNVRRQHAESTGLVLYDRHEADALATLDLVYGGGGRVQQRLVRRFIPPAAAAFYLDVPADVAVARKPGDLVGQEAVRVQITSYEGWLPRLPRVERLDATKPVRDLVAQVFSSVVQR